MVCKRYDVLLYFLCSIQWYFFLQCYMTIIESLCFDKNITRFARSFIIKLASFQYNLLADELYSFQSISIYLLLVIEKCIPVSCLVERSEIALQFSLFLSQLHFCLVLNHWKTFLIQSFSVQFSEKQESISRNVIMIQFCNCQHCSTFIYLFEFAVKALISL